MDQVPTSPPAPTATPPPSPAGDCMEAPSPGPIVTLGMREKYEQWVVKHASLARNFESALYIAPQLVPKTMVEPEVATQSGYAVIGLLHLYHDNVLYRSSHDSSIVPNTKNDDITRLVRVPLSIASKIQVIAEVLAGKWGGQIVKWRVIVWLETIKSLFRLVLIIQRRRGMLLRGGMYTGVQSSGEKQSVDDSLDKRGARTGKVFASKSTTIAPTSEKPSKSTTLTFDDATIPVEESSREGLMLGGEIMHVLRPPVYAFMRQSRPDSSWTPAIVAATIEITGLLCSAAALKPVESSKPAPTGTQKAQEELRARKMALLMYLLRDPMFDSVTKPTTNKVCDVLETIPLVGKVTRSVTDAVLNYMHQFYFYTSAS